MASSRHSEHRTFEVPANTFEARGQTFDVLGRRCLPRRIPSMSRVEGSMSRRILSRQEGIPLMSWVEGVCRGEYFRYLGSKVSAAANTFDVWGRRYLKIQGLDAHLGDPGLFRLTVRFSGCGRRNGCRIGGHIPLPGQLPQQKQQAAIPARADSLRHFSYR
jgi:hypothetical protein